MGMSAELLTRIESYGFVMVSPRGPMKDYRFYNPDGKMYLADIEEEARYFGAPATVIFGVPERDRLIRIGFYEYQGNIDIEVPLGVKGQINIAGGFAGLARRAAMGDVTVDTAAAILRLLEPEQRKAALKNAEGLPEPKPGRAAATDGKQGRLAAFLRDARKDQLRWVLFRLLDKHPPVVGIHELRELVIKTKPDITAAEFKKLSKPPTGSRQLSSKQKPPPVPVVPVWLHSYHAKVVRAVLEGMSENPVAAAPAVLLRKQLVAIAPDITEAAFKERIPKETLAWMKEQEKQAEEARKRGIREE